MQAFEGNLVWAAYLVGIAAVFDFLDGFAARMLKVSSPIGKDLDSLADMVTFGVVPGAVMFMMIFKVNLNSFFIALPSIAYAPLGCYSAFLIPIFSAIRLAKFNNDTRQSDSFIGVPTPANAIFICSLALVANEKSIGAILNPTILILISCVLSLLLVAPLPLFSLKFKSFDWKKNEIRYTFLALSLILLLSLQFVGIPLIIILYIVISIINNLLLKQ